jgi:hypothetical protein
MNSGKLITFEGLDGCGKSTQLEKAHDWLSSRGYTSSKPESPAVQKLASKSVVFFSIRNIKNYSLKVNCCSICQIGSSTFKKQ